MSSAYFQPDISKLDALQLSRIPPDLPRPLEEECIFPQELHSPQISDLCEEMSCPALYFIHVGPSHHFTKKKGKMILTKRILWTNATRPFAETRLKKKNKMPRRTAKRAWNTRQRGVHVMKWGCLLNHFPKFSNAVKKNKPLRSASQKSCYFFAHVLRKSVPQACRIMRWEGHSPILQEPTREIQGNLRG